MAKVDLNIVDRGTNSSEWKAEGTPLQSGDLDKVLEQKTDNSGALNSLPTPFARFFVAREAFRRVNEEKLNPKEGAGFAYTQLVSDILDVYELLFNLKYHKRNASASPTTSTPRRYGSPAPIICLLLEPLETMWSATLHVSMASRTSTAACGISA